MSYYTRAGFNQAGKTLREEQERVQKKTFTKWVNTTLCKLRPPIVVVDLFHDLKDGLVLLSLLEVLSGQTLSKEKGRNIQRVHFLTNVRSALEFLEKKGIKLVNINATDIVDGKPAIVLGLIWTIVLYFQIEAQDNNLLESESATGDGRSSEGQRAKISGRKALLNWVEGTIADKYGIEVKDFGASWRDGHAFNAIVHSMDASLVDMEQVKLRSNRENLEFAFNTAEQHLGVPKLLDAEDVDVEKPDEKSIMTYVTQFLQAKNTGGPGKEAAAAEEARLEELKSAALLTEKPARPPLSPLEELTIFLEQSDQILFDALKSDNDTEPDEELVQQILHIEQTMQTLEPTLMELERSSESGSSEADSRRVNGLRQKWNELGQHIKEWKWKVDSVLPGDLGKVGRWLAAAEKSLYTAWPKADHAEEYNELLKKRLLEHDSVFSQKEQIKTLFRSARTEYTERVSISQCQEIARRLNQIFKHEPVVLSKLQYLMTRHQLQRKADQLQQNVNNWSGDRLGDREEVVLLLEDCLHALEQENQLTETVKALDIFAERTADFVTLHPAEADDANQFFMLKEKDVKRLEKEVPEILLSLEAAVETWNHWNSESQRIKEWIIRAQQIPEEADEDYIAFNENEKREMERDLSKLALDVQYIRSNCRPEIGRSVKSDFENLQKGLNSLDTLIEDVMAQKQARKQEAVRALKAAEQERLQLIEQLRREEEEKRRRDEEIRLELQRLEEEKLKRLQERERLEAEERQRQEEENVRNLIDNASRIASRWLKQAKEMENRPIDWRISSITQAVNEMNHLVQEHTKVTAAMAEVKGASKNKDLERLKSQLDTLLSEEEKVSETVRKLQERSELLNRLLPDLENTESDLEDLHDWMNGGKRLASELQREGDPIRAKKLREQLKKHLVEVPDQAKVMNKLKNLHTKVENQQIPHLNVSSRKDELMKMEEEMKDLLQDHDRQQQSFQEYTNTADDAKLHLNRLKEALVTLEQSVTDDGITLGQKSAKMKEAELLQKEAEASLKLAVNQSLSAFDSLPRGESAAIREDLEQMESQMDDFVDHVKLMKNQLKSCQQDHEQLHDAGLALQQDMEQLRKSLKTLSRPNDQVELEIKSSNLKKLDTAAAALKAKIQQHIEECKRKNAEKDIIRSADATLRDLEHFMEDIQREAKKNDDGLAEMLVHNNKLSEVDELLEKAKRTKLSLSGLSYRDATDYDEAIRRLEEIKQYSQAADQKVQELRRSGQALSLYVDSTGLLQELRKRELDAQDIARDVDSQMHDMKTKQQMLTDASKAWDAVLQRSQQAIQKWRTLQRRVDSQDLKTVEEAEQLLGSLEDTIHELQSALTTLDKTAASLQTLPGGMGSSAVILETLPGTRSTHVRALEQAKEAHADWLKLVTALTSHKKTAEQFQHWTNQTQQRLEELNDLSSDKQAVHSRMASLMVLSDELENHCGDHRRLRDSLEGVRMSPNALLSRLEADLHEMDLRYTNSLTLCNKLRESADRETTAQQAFQRANRQVKECIEDNTLKLLRCADFTGNSEELQERVNICKDILMSMNEAKGKLEVLKDSRDALMHLSQQNGTPLDRDIVIQVQEREKDWDAMFERATKVSTNLEQLLSQWTNYSERKDRLAKWIREMDNIMDRVANDVDQADAENRRSLNERYKALLKETERQDVEFQNFRKAGDELQSSSKIPLPDSDIQRMLDHHRRIHSSLRGRIQALDEEDSQMQLYNECLENCEKWILQTSFRLLHDDQQASLSGQDRTDKHQLVTFLTEQWAEHDKVSEEIVDKAKDISRVFSLGEQLMRSGHVHVTPQLNHLQAHYSELCDSERRARFRLEEAILLLMDQFLNGDLAFWWQEENALAAEQIRDLAMCNQEAHKMLLKMDDLWGFVQPFVHRTKQNAAEHGNDNISLNTLALKLASQTPAERSKLVNYINALEEREINLKRLERKLTDQQQWLASKQREWLDFMTNDESIDNLVPFLNEVQSKENDLRDLQRTAHSLLQEGLSLETHKALSHLFEGYEDLKRRLEEEIAIIEKRRQEELMEKAMKLQEASAFVEPTNDEVIISSFKMTPVMTSSRALPSYALHSDSRLKAIVPAVQSDWQEWGLRNSGGNHGISKQFWPYCTSEVITGSNISLSNGHCNGHYRGGSSSQYTPSPVQPNVTLNIHLSRSASNLHQAASFSSSANAPTYSTTARRYTVYEPIESSNSPKAAAISYQPNATSSSQKYGQVSSSMGSLQSPKRSTATVLQTFQSNASETHNSTGSNNSLVSRDSDLLHSSFSQRKYTAPYTGSRPLLSLNYVKAKTSESSRSRRLINNAATDGNSVGGPAQQHQHIVPRQSSAPVVKSMEFPRGVSRSSTTLYSNTSDNVAEGWNSRAGNRSLLRSSIEPFTDTGREPFMKLLFDYGNSKAVLSSTGRQAVLIQTTDSLLPNTTVIQSAPLMPNSLAAAWRSDSASNSAREIREISERLKQLVS